MQLPLYFNNAVVAQLPLPEDTVITRELMGADEVQVSVTLPSTLQCPIGAYVILNGWRYSINTIPSPTVTGDENGLRYTYKLTFESPVYSLYNKGLRYLNNKTFQFTGDLSEMAYLVVSNINEIEPGWSVGIVDDLGIKAVDFDKHSCRTALNKIAEVFSCEWYASGVDGRTLNFVKLAGQLTTLEFEYGMGKGLYSLGFDYQSDKNIVTRAYGYGSSRNLPANYRGGATELMFDGYFLEKNTALYRIREGDYIDEDIYPTVQGVVTATSAYDKDAATFTITDTALSFDLNNYFSPDTPQVTFTSGQLMGQIFDISKYDHASRTILLNKVTDPAGNTLPGQVVTVEPGDKYVLTQMYMPDEVVAAAEQKLRDKTQEYLNENCVPRVLYSLELDPLYARDHGIKLNPGDQITVRHAALGIDALIRVTSVSYPVNFPLVTPSTKITATIANFVPYTVQERVIAATINTQTAVKVVNRVNAERARNNAANLKRLQSRIFNPDGSLFTGVNSVVAGMATIGFDSQNYNLNGVVIAANNGADPNALAISGGTLTHYTYKIDGLGYIWNMAPHDWTGLDSGKFYYVYAKCSTSSLVGTWEISETPVGVGDVPGYWAFNLGILYEANAAGYRDFEFTKGMSYLVGDQITTGRVKSQDGQNYLDLNDGKFNLGDAASGIDWDVTNPGVMTIRGGVATDIIRVGTNALISGLDDPTDPSKSIRFAAGPNGEFMVLDNGAVNMTNAYIEGTIKADSGNIGNFSIDQFGLKNTQNRDAYVIQQSVVLDPSGSTTREASIGTGISSGGWLGVFSNSSTTGNPTNGVTIACEGGPTADPANADLTGNRALSVTGDIVQAGGKTIIGGDIRFNGKIKVGTDEGFTGSYDIRSASFPGGFATFTWKKGILVSVTT